MPTLEIEIPDKYADKLAAVERVEPSIREQIEIELLPDALRLINEAHRQLQETDSGAVAENLNPEE